MQREEKITVGISVGDLNGIGGELIIKTFNDLRFLEFCTPVIFASSKYFSFLKKHFKSEIRFNAINNLGGIVHGKLNVYNIWREPVDIKFGQEDPKTGKYAIKSFQSATKALKDKAIDVLVTAPIHKHNVQSEEFKFPGHTDYLNQELDGESLMFMVTEQLKVGLLTDHIPVKDVSEHLSDDLIDKKISSMHQSLVQDFGIRKPKIAVLGVNPHTGDNGVIGKEDDEILKPALSRIREEGKLVFGPYSADSFFGSSAYKNFDAVLAMYHDQGLIPFKTLSFGQGVNFTAGLNRIRTSPDHGTAFEIAGKGVADNNSFKEAIFMAIQIYKNRSLYAELTENQLRKKA
ncbi:MAG: 4-hydroxythreonine-4-phosphate dehydrogenase PdxA [Flavobacteriaceae bacterium]|nr:4-hydroxythreonine-4-phosphate dehydrogenase PdxA [Bacteroidia bacterium]MBT8288832.1 4-hydroxythreonine-4-phosphate dehydrogenase PdxA [Bacteroidia bacterium]NNF76208.1 4-hydroxythreonine-4-phosphate dehydrogenase PdxA [Flavobacteriaceae bacterium]NNK72894.1 4-hydroxythreonine-4-phosphate dehydrogenase PdxA [Flavobacteriaceae bacterium]